MSVCNSRSRQGQLRAALAGASIVGVCLVGSAGCGAPPLSGTFTSRVVQLDTCRVIGAADEGCEQAEEIAELRVDLVPVDERTWWLYGVPRGGVDGGALLGSRDTEGGILFVDESVQRNDDTGCTLTVRTELSLRVDPARAADVGAPCVSLVGRQVDTTKSSAECDSVGVPPQAVQRLVRRRWEPLDASSACAP